MVNLAKGDCVGCGSCQSTCPTSAITMKPDKEGFLYPYVQADNCIGCHACIDHCPVYGDEAALFDLGAPLATRAGWARDPADRMSGSSGGIFGELAKAVLQQEGYVVGAAFTAEHRVQHQLIHSLEDLSKLKKSKYMQSDMGTVFSDIQRLTGRQAQVLFVGTPCQCAGLRAFLGGQPENIILCDFICHGVNSPLVHQKYINEVEQKFGNKILEIDHRDKSDGWENYQVSVQYAGRKFSLGGKRVNPFLRGFLTDLYLRPSCFQCNFKGTSRPTDLTLADCWGYPSNEPMGVSLVLIHSAKGEALLNQIHAKVWLEDYLLADVVDKNPSICKSAEDRFQKRKLFFSELNKHGSLSDAIIDLLGQM